MRLEVRVSLWLLALFGVAGAVALVATAAFQRQTLERQFQNTGQVLALTVENSLEVSMLHNAPDDVRQAIADLRRGAPIESVSVYGRSANVWVSSAGSGDPVPPARAALHSALSGGRPASATSGGRLWVFVPVANQPRCARCHGGASTVLGAVGVALDERPLRSELTHSTWDSMYFAAIPLLIGLLASLWAIRRSLLRPLSMVGHTAARLAAGNLSVRLPAFRSAELGAVATTFNEMAGRLERQAMDLTSTVEQLRSDLEGMEEIHSLLSSGAGLRDILARTAGRLGSALGAAGVAIWTGEASRPETLWGHGVPTERPGQPPSAGVQTSEGPLSSVREDRPIGWAVVPARRGGQTVALMGVSWDPPKPLARGERDLLKSLTGVVAVAVENADLLERLREEEQSLEALLAKTLTAQEDERRRLARELHDETSQILSALIMNIDVLEAQAALPEPSGSRLGAAKALAEEAARNLDKVLLDLRPALLDELGLVAALRWYVSQFRDMWALPVEFTTEGARRVPQHVEVAAFRIAQEALSNVARHAHATTVRVRVAVDERAVRVEVLDDGVGFDASEAMARARTGQAAGLMGMRERAELLGGRLEVRSRPGEGTRVAAEIPFSEPAGAGDRPPERAPAAAVAGVAGTLEGDDPGPSPVGGW